MILSVLASLGVLGWALGHLRASPWVGIHVDLVDTTALVVAIDPGSPAEEAGVVVGDTLTEVGGKAILWQSFLADHDQSTSWASVDRYWEGQARLREALHRNVSTSLGLSRPGGRVVVEIVSGWMPWRVVVRRLGLPSLLALAWLLVAFLVARKVQTEQSAVLVLAATSVSILLFTMAVIVERELSGPMASQIWMQRVNHMASSVSSLAALWFSMVFPESIAWIRKRPQRVRAAFVAVGCFLVFGQFLRWAPGPIHLSYGASALLNVAFLLVLAAVFTRSKQAVHRHQIQWVFLGFALGVLPYLLLTEVPLVLGWPSIPQEITALGSVAFPVTIGLAIRRWRLFTISDLFDGGLLRVGGAALLVAAEIASLYAVTFLWDAPHRVDLPQIVVLLGVFFVWNKFRRKYLHAGRTPGIELENLRRELPSLVDKLAAGRTLGQALGETLSLTFGTRVHSLFEVDWNRRIPYQGEDEWIWSAQRRILESIDSHGGLMAGFELPGAEVGDVPPDVESCVLMSLPCPSGGREILTLGPRWSPDSWSAHDVETIRALLGVAIPLADAASRWHVEEHRRRAILEAAREELEVRVAERTEDLEAANGKLREALSTRESFLAQMSHELRTPLSAVLAGVEAVKEGVDGPVLAPMARRLSMVERNGRHLLSLIQDILDFTRGRAGKLPINPIPCRTDRILDQALELVGPQIADGKVKLIRDGARGADGAVLADPLRLRQILTNLVANAIRHGKGEVEIGIDADAETVRILVSDRGDGIAEEMVSRLFMPFERFGPEKDPRASTGLGLALSRQLAQAMRGDLVYRNREGGGAVFELTLPRSESIPLDEESVGPPAPSDATGRSLLVVDDQKDLRELCVEYFEALGWEAFGAGSAEEALQIISTGMPDAVVTDLGLPGVDGVELVRRLRQLPKGRRLAVIVLTGAALPEERLRCLQAGADDFHVKPFLLSDLASRLDELVHDRRLES